MTDAAPPAGRVAGWFAGLTVTVQIPYPLVHGSARDALTVASVLALCAASVSHAARWRGPGFAAGLLVGAAGGGLLAEAVGVRTGVPFGSYRYADSLGPKVAGVPAVVPLAWAMMAYPALLAGRRVAAGRARRPVTDTGPAADHETGPAGESGRTQEAEATRQTGGGRLTAAVVGGLVLAAWDLFLDPQMVAAGHWRWAPGGGPALNGIPLTNAAGWFAVGTLLVAALDAVPDPTRRAGAGGRAGGTGGRRIPAPDDRLPFALLGWTYASSLLANLAFFGRPAVALAGGVGMGAVLAAVVWAGRAPRSATAPPPPPSSAPSSAAARATGTGRS